MKKRHVMIIVKVIFNFCVYMADNCDAHNVKTRDEAAGNRIPCQSRGNIFTFWEQNRPAHPKIIYYQYYDTIYLTIKQLNVPRSFAYYELASKYLDLVQYPGKSEEYEDINGVNFYNKPSYDVTQPMKIQLKKKSYSQSIKISLYNYGHSYRKNIKKKLYQLHLLDNQIYTFYDVNYTVDWSTGCDNIEINKRFEIKPVTSGKSDLDISPELDTTTDETPKETGGIQTPLIVGIVAAVMLIMSMLVAIWILKKIRNKMKEESFYCEIQYVDLQLKETNTAPPIASDVIYTRVKGVLLPIDGGNERTEGIF